MAHHETVSPLTFSVVTLNTLLDRRHGDAVAPQAARLASCARALLALDMPLDVVCLQEVEGNNGSQIAASCGFDDSYWAVHPKYRKNEHIGMFGERVRYMTALPLGLGKTAVVTTVEGVPVFGVHLRAGHRQTAARHRETRALLWHTLGHSTAVVVGDANGPRWDPARRLLTKSGFTHDTVSPVATFPASEYRDTMLSPTKSWLLSRGMELDVIMTKGEIEVVEQGVVTGADSDHLGRWARLRVAQNVEQLASVPLE